MVSIAMATYNGEKYIREQLDSILSQTYKDFELVICDDCSKDSTRQILSEYEKQDNRIKVYLNEHNLGFKKNFEKAITLCNGEYIALSDQDDVWLPEHLQVLLDNIEGHAMAGGDAIIIDGEGKETGNTLSQQIEFDTRRNYRIFYRIFCNSSVFYGHSSMYNTVELKKALPVPKDINYHDAWFSACACVAPGGCKWVNKTISKYRLHGKNASGNHDRYNFFQKIKRFFTIKIESDRIIYCDEILKRNDALSDEQKKQLLEVKHYFEARTTNTNKIMACKYISKYYNDIYTQPNKKGLYLKLINILIRYK